MKDSFDKAFLNILSNNGSYVNTYYSETNMGVTKKDLKKANDMNLVSTTVMFHLKLDEAKLIYKTFYWDKYDLDSLPYPIDRIIFDMIININEADTMKIIKRAINELKINIRINDKYDDDTKKDIIVASRLNASDFAEWLLYKESRYYYELAVKKSNKEEIISTNVGRIRTLAKECGVNLVW